MLPFGFVLYHVRSGIASALYFGVIYNRGVQTKPEQKTEPRNQKYRTEKPINQKHFQISVFDLVMVQLVTEPKKSVNRAAKLVNFFGSVMVRVLDEPKF